MIIGTRQVALKDIPRYGEYEGGERIDLPRGMYATIKVRIDEDTESPWERSDGHGIVSDWTTRDKTPGERVLAEDRRSKRYYDFAGTIAIAKRDGWDAKPYKTGTKGQQAERAVNADFEYLRRWCADQWHYIGIVVELFDKDGGTLADDSLWGVEDDGDYWREEAASMVNAMFETELASRKAARIAAAKETKERRHWENRDVVTV